MRGSEHNSSIRLQNTPIQLLLARAGDHRPVFPEGIPHRGIPNPLFPTPVNLPGALRDGNADPNDLTRQGWGLVIPSGDRGVELRDYIAPLIERRCHELGSTGLKTFLVDRDLVARDGSHTWMNQTIRPGLMLENRMPYYLLILGDLDEVPLAVQHALSGYTLVGRLAFDHRDEYRAYAEKVCRIEQLGPVSERADAVLYAVDDDDDPVRQGYDTLIQPGYELLSHYPSCSHEVHLSRSSDVLDGANLSERPTFLVTLSHGEGAPLRGWSSPDEQRRFQGSLCLGTSERIAGQDVTDRTLLPGGVWLMVACFGAGTPERSCFEPWLRKLREIGCLERSVESFLRSLVPAGQPPFIASLPKKALANPHGPLAFIGHVDTAFSYAFLDLDDRVAPLRPGRLMEIVRRTLDGGRVGNAFDALVEARDQVARALLSEAAQPPAEYDNRGRARMAHRQLLYHDLKGYILLGDPAVRMPLTDVGRV